MNTVVIASYSKEWPLRFAEVRAELLGAFTSSHIEIEHIGSTAVPGLAAKPIIDVLLGADALGTIENASHGLSQRGYEYVSKYEGEFPARRYFVKAASHPTLRVNLHAVTRGSQFWREHIAFRDALRSSPSLVSRYQELKLHLAAELAQDRPAYTAAKAPFIQAVIASVLANASVESAHCGKPQWARF